MRMQASRELLAPRPDVWGFVAEPFHLADWWPGVSGVQPDRRGSAAGARWEIVASREPTLLRKPGASGTVVVTASDKPVALRLRTRRGEARRARRPRSA
jgi:hypothetical protein